MSISELWSTRTVTEGECTTRGSVEPIQINRVMRAIDRVLRCHHVDEPARVRLTGAPCSGGPMLAQANVVFRNRPVRVQVPGPSGFIATFLADRLDRGFARLNSDAVPRYWPDPARPPLAAPSDEEPIVRRKHCALLIGTPADAVRVMDAMDYDAYLFTDAETGEDAVVYWAGPLGVRMARQQQRQLPEVLSGLSLTMNPLPTPRLTEAEAAARLCRYGLPFLFCTDPSGGRGRLLYRRYDGALTIVLPATGGEPA
ncbi:sigma 54 modulation/S30EA ribosomal C-terminal domain-containing protein [Nocardia sp. NPDC052112]|uniref:sigma 54 modulation/S30EA ribosomal C-terminal domain-containing protein n=1 Tax=Nocardia sp. NPDC052112 TaxID=3155646 RepID=UPI00344737C2